MSKEQLKQNIEKMKRELAKMEAELEKSEKVELEEELFLIDSNGSIEEADMRPIYYRMNGATRATEELAEIASRNMVARNKLEAYAMQLEPEWRDKGCGSEVWAIYTDGSEYLFSSNNGIRELGKVYMSKQTAETLCQWLNEGRITLERE